MISKQDIQKIFETARIEEVVGEFINLRKRGVNYVGLCPFHHEKTPSFTVSPAKNFYKCFGCSAAGNSVNFLMEHEHYTYPEALRYLANKYGIEITELKADSSDQEIENEQQLLFYLHELAQKYYAQVLHDTEDGKIIGLSYLRKRGFTDQSIEKFGLGYAPDGNNGFVAHALSLGYTHDALKKAGLLSESSGNNDKFRGRIIFPIYSISGRVLAFGARLMSKSDKAPKYLNSPETLIYHKSQILYGIQLAKKSILKLDFCYLVEGYTDVISMNQAGIENIVASSGTSLTQEQIRLIQRYTQNITIVYDGDKAGIKASFRGIDMILETGMNVRVVLLPENEDPDSFVQQRSSNEIDSYLKENTISFISFKSKILSEDAQNDPIKRAEMIKDIVQSISLIPDGITRAIFARECSSLIQVQETILVNEISKYIRKRYLSKNKPEAEQKILNDLEDERTVLPAQNIGAEYSLEFAERRIAWLLLNFPSFKLNVSEKNEQNEIIQIEKPLYRFIVDSLKKDMLLPIDAKCNEIFNYFDNENIEILDILQSSIFLEKNIKEDIRIFAIDLLSFPYSLSPNWKLLRGIQIPTVENVPALLKREVEDTIYSYKLLRLETEHLKLTEKLQNTSDENEQIEILTKINNINKIMSVISNILGMSRLD